MAVIIRSVENVLSLSQAVFEAVATNFPFYGTLNGANGFHAAMLEGQRWAETDPLRRVQALRSATQRINNLSFKGSRTDAAQNGEWPRFGSTTVPSAIEQATYLVALALLEGVEPDTEAINLRAITSGFGSLRSDFDRDKVPHHIICGIPSKLAWDLLLPYLYEQRGLDMERVS